MNWPALASVSLLVVLGACGGKSDPDTGSSGNGGVGGVGGKAGGTGGTGTGGTGTGGTGPGGTGTGGTGGTGTGGTGTGGTGTGTGGTTGGTGGNAACDALAADHAASLAEAKRCSRFPGGPEPCTVDVGSDLICDCPVRVDGQNTAALADLADIETEWDALGCGEPCAADCAAPSGATCAAGGQGGDVGVCVSTF